MKKETYWFNRIIPFPQVLYSILRSFWYLRTVLILLLITILSSAFLLSMVEKCLPPKDGIRPVSSFAESLFVSFAAATSLETGGVGAVSTIGRILLIIDAFMGIIFIGIVVWVIQFCLGESTLKESRCLLLSSKKDAVIDKND